jgi:hypothetical protein
MPTYITADAVRRRSGAPSSLISDSDVESFIDEVEESMERWLNTKFTPTKTIDVLDGNGLPYIFVKKTPLLAVRQLKDDGESQTVSNLDIYRESGKIEYGQNSSESYFVRRNRSVIVEYYYAWVTKSSTETETDADASAGTSVDLSVDSSTGFSTNDWVEIVGMDGYQEAAKVTATDTGEITVDKLLFSHENGSIVTKLDVPQFIKDFMLIESSIYVAIKAIGGTYTFNTNYSLGDLAVTKGVPYPHWNTSFNDLVKEREQLRKKIKPRFSMGT